MIRNPDSMYISELEALLAELGEPSYRARQIFSWFHAKDAVSYEQMTDLSKALRERLSAGYPPAGLTAVKMLESAIDGTRKYLFRLGDGNVIESVRMIYEHGVSVCVSTQAGCRMGCRFCASTIDGLARSLTASEIAGQVYSIRRDCGQRVSHVVFMGSGEPLENFDETVRAIRLLSDPAGQQISQRNMTLSTCGLVPGIYDLAKEDLAITLAISLHAANDALRAKLMPVASRYTLDELMAACRAYFDSTGRRVSFEYALFDGVNDSEEDAARLAALIGGMNAHVNLIPANPVKERNYARPGSGRVLRFYKKLEKCGINVTIRREMGADIQGACGQLRKSYKDTDQETKE